MPPIPLHGLPTPVEIAPGYSLYAPGLTGRVSASDEGGEATRSVGLEDDALLRAFHGAEIEPLQSFDLEIDLPGLEESGTRSLDEGPMRLAAPSLGENVGYAALHTDEWGTLRWLFPVERQPAEEGTRGGGGAVVFELPTGPAVPPAVRPEEEGTRGAVTGVMRRSVRVVAWLTDDLIGAGALEAARRWEGKNRPYGLVRLLPGEVRPLPPDALASLGAGRALLLLHGTFSTAAGAFGALAASPHYRSLMQHYGERIFAFDHPSLHHSPAENVAWLLAALPDVPLEVDVLTHSRGGLVGRELAERRPADGPARQLRVRRALYVAAPHQGTRLADGDHWISFVDRYTNLLVALPDTHAAITLEGVMVAVKLLAHGILKGLPGLQSFNPSGKYLERLNKGAPHGSEYYAIAADFTPDDPGLLARFYRKAGDKVLDLLFEEPNDMVVPTRGCFEAGPASPGFPIPAARRRLFELDARLHHCNYFASDAVNRQIVAWLTAPE